MDVATLEPIAVLVAAAVDIRTTPAGDLGITTEVAMEAIRRGVQGGAR